MCFVISYLAWCITSHFSSFCLYVMRVAFSIIITVFGYQVLASDYAGKQSDCTVFISHFTPQTSCRIFSFIIYCALKRHKPILNFGLCSSSSVYDRTFYTVINKCEVTNQRGRSPLKKYQVCVDCETFCFAQIYVFDAQRNENWNKLNDIYDTIYLCKLM